MLLRDCQLPEVRMMLKKLVCCTETALKNVGIFQAAKIVGVNYQDDLPGFNASVMKCRVCDKLFSRKGG